MSVCTQWNEDLITQKDGIISTFEFSRMLHEPQEQTQKDMRLTTVAIQIVNQSDICVNLSLCTRTHTYIDFHRVRCTYTHISSQ